MVLLSEDDIYKIFIPSEYSEQVSEPRGILEVHLKSLIYIMKKVRLWNLNDLPNSESVPVTEAGLDLSLRTTLK